MPDDTRLTTLLHLAQQAARHRGRVDDRTWQAARRHGWSPAALLEALTPVTLVLFVDLAPTRSTWSPTCPAARDGLTLPAA